MRLSLSKGTRRGLRQAQPAAHDTIGGWQSRGGRITPGAEPGGTVRDAVNRLGGLDGLLRSLDLAWRVPGTSLLLLKMRIRVLYTRLCAPSCAAYLKILLRLSPRI
jgi:hypothetical protein